MRQRQPNGPDLVVPRPPGIHNAPSDVEMRLGVAIVQSPAGMIYVSCREAADRGHHHENQREFDPDVLQCAGFKTR